MSASEKLKGLLAETTQEWPEGQAGTSCIDCFTPVPSVAVQVMPALPQIVAVVEAAERIPKQGDSSSTWVEQVQAAFAALDDLRAALAALDKELT